MRKSLLILFLLSLSCATADVVSTVAVFQKTTLPDVDKVAAGILPLRVHDCGVHGDPNVPGMVILGKAYIPWPAAACIQRALKHRVPFIARYRGNTIDSGTETVFLANRERVFMIYKDTAGPFTVHACAFDKTRMEPQSGLVCSEWRLVRDLRGEGWP